MKASKANFDESNASACVWIYWPLLFILLLWLISHDLMIFTHWLNSVASHNVFSFHTLYYWIWSPIIISPFLPDDFCITTIKFPTYHCCTFLLDKFCTSFILISSLYLSIYPGDTDCSQNCNLQHFVMTFYMVYILDIESFLLVNRTQIYDNTSKTFFVILLFHYHLLTLTNEIWLWLTLLRCVKHELI